MSRLILIALVGLLLLGCGGGTRWNLIITSEPPEALVYVNEFPRGVTPIEVPYIWIGTYRIDVQSPGHTPIHDVQKIGKPWYTWIPFAGLFLDMLPGRVSHGVELHYDLEPLPQETF